MRGGREEGRRKVQVEQRWEEKKLLWSIEQDVVGEERGDDKAYITKSVCLCEFVCACVCVCVRVCVYVCMCEKRYSKSLKQRRIQWT